MKSEHSDKSDILKFSSYPAHQQPIRSWRG